MGDGEQVEYSLTKENGETTKSSRDYTGKGTATYQNTETYEGEFLEGVNLQNKINKRKNLNFFVTYFQKNKIY